MTPTWVMVSWPGFTRGAGTLGFIMTSKGTLYLLPAETDPRSPDSIPLCLSLAPFFLPCSSLPPSFPALPLCLPGMHIPQDSSQPSAPSGSLPRPPFPAELGAPLLSCHNFCAPICPSPDHTSVTAGGLSLYPVRPSVS